MAYLQAVLLLALGLICAADSSCDCFRTLDGSASTYANHALLDFSKVAGTTSSAFLTSAAFTSLFFIGDGNSSASAIAPLAKFNQRQNINIVSDSGSPPSYLRMQSTRLSDSQSIAQIDSVASDILFGSFRVRCRIHGAPGAVAGIFTYASNSQESDIEILTTESPRQFHATNQPNSVPDATTVVQIPGSVADSTEWRLNWGAGMTQTLVNGSVVNKKTVHTPTQPGSFIVNLWSDGGEWSGMMPMGQSAYMDIEFIEMVYNRSSDGAKACGRVCDIGSSTSSATTSSLSLVSTSSGLSSSHSAITTTVVGRTSPISSASSVLSTAINPSTTGSIDQCGSNNGGETCAPGLCCSAHGYCGTSFYYCAAGCQAGFGTCWK